MNELPYLSSLEISLTLGDLILVQETEGHGISGNWTTQAIQINTLQTVFHVVYGETYWIIVYTPCLSKCWYPLDPYVVYIICTYTGGLNHLFRRIIFSILEHGKWLLKNCISFSWSEEIIVNWIEFGKFSSQFYGEYFWLNRMQRFIL